MLQTVSSISSRNLMYIPKSVQKKLKIRRPGRVILTMVDNMLVVRPVVDVMGFAGDLKKKAKPTDFDFRKHMEENYGQLDRY